MGGRVGAAGQGGGRPSPVRPQRTKLEKHEVGGKQPPTVQLVICEDNEAVIKILLKGRALALRHVGRTHRVAIDWLVEVIKSESTQLKYVTTSPT